MAGFPGGPRLVVSDAPEPELHAVIARGLSRFNAEQAGISDSRPLAVVARDPGTGEVIGGLTGRTSLGVLFVDLFFLPAAVRGGGLGGRILELAEEEARRRGCQTAVLYTLSFQAPGFYERHGYRVFGEVACQPPGTRRLFMAKSLA